MAVVKRLLFARDPISDRFCDVACSSFAAWTLLAHGAIVIGAGMADLLKVVAAAGLVCIALMYWRRSHGARIAGATPARTIPASHQPWLWILGLLAVIVTWMAHRPDLDDSLYMSIAVAAADFPDLPLLRFDTLHGIPDLPIHHPAYQLQTLELLEGALAYVTGVGAIYWSHFGMAGIAALLLVFAHARLFRLLVPKRWLWCLAAVLLIFVTVGDTHRWYGNFAFVRLQQGKAIVATALAPLITCYALEFMAEPRWGRWLRLAACQIAAVGMTATAVWLGPTVALLGLATGWKPGLRRSRIFLFGLLASAYPLASGLELRMDMVQQTDRPRPTIEQASENKPQASKNRPRQDIYFAPAGISLQTPWNKARKLVLGDGILCWVVTAAGLLAWLLSPERLARRYCLLYPLGFLFLFNPLAADWVSGNITGATTYWRVFWVLPAPVLLAFCLTAPLAGNPLAASAGSRNIPRRAAATVALLAIFVAIVPETWIFSRENEAAALRFFELDVPAEYKYAKILATHVAPGATVLAPIRISPWIVTLHDHPNPLITRLHYRGVLRRHLGNAEVKDRTSLTQSVSKTTSRRKKHQLKKRRSLLRGIDKYKIQGICLSRAVRWQNEPDEKLMARGFNKIFEDRQYQIWVRDAG